MIDETIDRMRLAVTRPMSGRVPTPTDMRTGEIDTPWTANVLALRLATVTREPQPTPSTPLLLPTPFRRVGGPL